MKADPMRVLAWWLVALGIIIALGAPVWTVAERARLTAEIGRSTELLRLRSADAQWKAREDLSAWPIAGAGAGVTVLGILLLAIRKQARLT